jgi:hypothetical protein
MLDATCLNHGNFQECGSQVDTELTMAGTGNFVARKMLPGEWIATHHKG